MADVFFNILSVHYFFKLQNKLKRI